MIKRGGRVFHARCEWIDVTSLHRPDTSWEHKDSYGHDHRWYEYTEAGTLVPSFRYSPQQSYRLPTLKRITDVEATEEQPGVFHYECIACQERIEPGFRADDTVQRIPGLKSFYIDDRSVSEEEFRREWEKVKDDV